MNEKQKGKLVVIEGIQGSGKSTVFKNLQKMYQKELSDIHFTKEPGGSKAGDLIYNELFVSELSKELDPLTFFCLIWASRREHITKTIRPKIEQGINIISDRFHSSTYAIQISADGREDMEDVFDRMTEIVVGESVPDLYIYLQIDPKIAAERKGIRKRDSYFDVQKLDYYKKVDQGYKNFFKDKNVIEINAEQTPEKVTEDLFNTLVDYLDLKI